MGQSRATLITGAGSGIGRETAALFASKGWLVGAADVNEQSVRNLAAECPANSIVPIQADVSTRAGARAMVGAHGRRVLWRVGLDATARNIAVRILGSHSRGLCKLPTRY